mgnify:CR=1 FL=1
MPSLIVSERDKFSNNVVLAWIGRERQTGAFATNGGPLSLVGGVVPSEIHLDVNASTAETKFLAWPPDTVGHGLKATL